MDLHQKEIQGFFDCPVDNLRASPFLLQYIQESVSRHLKHNNFSKFLIETKFCASLQIPDYRNSVIVARNPGSAKKATSYAERLRLGIAVIHGEQKESESDEVDGRYSPPALNRFVLFVRDKPKGDSLIQIQFTVDHVRWMFLLEFQFIQLKRNHQLM